MEDAALATRQWRVQVDERRDGLAQDTQPLQPREGRQRHGEAEALEMDRVCGRGLQPIGKAAAGHEWEDEARPAVLLDVVPEERQ
eukprot:7198513-Prymnesium_polylepis.1